MRRHLTSDLGRIVLLLAVTCTQSKAQPMAGVTSLDPLLRRQDYCYAFWPNGFRKEKVDASANVFAVESGRYGFALDLADFRNAPLGTIEGPGYLATGRTGAKPVTDLPRADFRIEIEHQGNVYRAISCLAGRRRDLRDTTMLESGRFAQHCRFPGLRFEDDDGNVLETDSTCELMAWPSSLTFALRAAPDVAYGDGLCPGVVGAGRVFRGVPMDVPHHPDLDPQVFTLEMWVNVPQKLSQHNSRHWLIGKNENEWEEGNFGLMYHRGDVSAIMNTGGGRENVFRVDRRKALTTNEWCHLAMTYDNDTLRLYVNGKPAGSKKVGKARGSGTGNLRIGERPDGKGEPIHAVFDGLRIWDRPLGPEEIRAHVKAPAEADRDGLTWEMTFDTPSTGVPDEPNLRGAKVRISLNDMTMTEHVNANWGFGKSREFTLHCPMADEAWRTAQLTFTATGDEGMVFTTRHVPMAGAYVIDVPRLGRDWKTGYTDIRQYDEVELKIENGSTARHHVPVLFDVKQPANITGQVPILCDADGRPTGIPVQLSKNWHHGAYAKFYAILPAAPGKTHYRLRIAYGFWGTLPSASHAQLSLWGYGGNGRWDQLAIGCWGETICFDMDNSCTGMMITDVRMLLTRNGKEGRKWSWSDGGWGGDWIAVKRDGENKLMPTELKTAYLAHGPCLTDVRSSGYYGKDRDISFDARIATLRTDDHNRVFQTFSYRFTKPLSAANSHLFKMGPTRGMLTPHIAYGNRDGLIAEHEVPGNLEAGTAFMEGIPLTGPGPWWVAFSGSFFRNGKGWGTGSRALIIRSFKATYADKACDAPMISFPVCAVDKAKDLVGLNLELVVPKDVTPFAPGDAMQMTRKRRRWPCPRMGTFT